MKSLTRTPRALTKLQRQTLLTTTSSLLVLVIRSSSDLHIGLRHSFLLNSPRLLTYHTLLLVYITLNIIHTLLLPGKWTAAETTVMCDVPPQGEVDITKATLLVLHRIIPTRPARVCTTRSLTSVTSTLIQIQMIKQTIKLEGIILLT